MYSEGNECENVVRKGKTEEDVKITKRSKNKQRIKWDMREIIQKKYIKINGRRKIKKRI